MSGDSAIVTGAASGIGAAVVARLRQRGWPVAGVDLAPSEADLSIEADVRDDSALRRAVDHTADALGPPALLVTAAGYYERLPIGDIDPDRWQRMLDVHLGGTLAACAAVLDGMVDRRRGRIVTIASELALCGGTHDAHYVAAKGAVIGFTKSLAVELARSGVLANCVAPGPTNTPLLDPSARRADYLQTLPLRRLVAPGEVAEAVCFLASADSYLVGQVLSPNAGAVI